MQTVAFVGKQAMQEQGQGATQEEGQRKSNPFAAWLRRRNWRKGLSVLPLPMLALAASYGVYEFSHLFVPREVAVVQAAAFELTYIGLASLQDLTARQRIRAQRIAFGAVVVSVLYNSLAGHFHIQPQALEQLLALQVYGFPLGAGLLSILHGAPLALVAYYVADLLLHNQEEQEQEQEEEEGQEQEEGQGKSARARARASKGKSRSRTQRKRNETGKLDDIDRKIIALRAQGVTWAQIGQEVGKTRQAVTQRYKRAKAAAPGRVEQLEAAS